MHNLTLSKFTVVLHMQNVNTMGAQESSYITLEFERNPIPIVQIVQISIEIIAVRRQQ